MWSKREDRWGREAKDHWTKVRLREGHGRVAGTAVSLLRAPQRKPPLEITAF